MRNHFWIFILILFLITACAPRYDRLFSSACSAPCWYAVTPGITTRDEVLKLMPTFPYYQADKIRWYDENNQYTAVVPDSPTSEFLMDMGDKGGNNGPEVSITFQGTVVANIGFYSGIDMFQNHIFLGPKLIDMIHLYGTPDYLFGSQGCGGDVICANLNFVYPRRGVLVAFEMYSSPAGYRVSPTLPVVDMVYFQPPDFKNALTSLPYIDHVNCDPIPFMHPWQGFTTLGFDIGFDGCE